MVATRAAATAADTGPGLLVLRTLYCCSCKWKPRLSGHQRTQTRGDVLKRMLRSIQGLRVMGALVEIRSIPVAA